ncbi:cytochrome P450 [Georgenia halophila]|uniref:Cytochrome P450 n=1 Tax=Georgenia halophila TaxID=620889 RepID=A0ABP8LCE0_9MICO
MPATLPRLSVGETVRVAVGVLAPMLAQGVIIRRPGVVSLADSLDTNRHACRILGDLRERYGAGPVLLRLPVRELAVVLDPDDVATLLDGSPRPFTPANREKVTALRHFEPMGVLISGEERRALRRPWNEDVLDHRESLHRLHDHIVAVVAEELEGLLPSDAPVLTWDRFTPVFWRIVRRVVLGDAARDDEAITDLMVALRAQANWAFLRPRSTRRLRELGRRLRTYVADADPQSIAGVVARTPGVPGTAELGQIPQWLFAFDAAGIATYRALALLTGHPAAMAEVRQEDLPTHRGLRPLARATVLESLRLWPTTLTILRDGVEETHWSGGTAAPGTGFAIISTFFHRDRSRLPWADEFEPAIWDDGRAEISRALVPFSAGPAQCPGRTLVLDVTSELLAGIVSQFDVAAAPPVRIRSERAMPRTLAHNRLRFHLARRAAG